MLEFLKKLFGFDQETLKDANVCLEQQDKEQPVCYRCCHACKNSTQNKTQ